MTDFLYTQRATLGSFMVTWGRGLRVVSLFSCQAKNIWQTFLVEGAGLLCPVKEEQSAPQFPACAQSGQSLSSSEVKGVFSTQWLALPHLKQAPGGVLLCPSSSMEETGGAPRSWNVSLLWKASFFFLIKHFKYYILRSLNWSPVPPGFETRDPRQVRKQLVALVEHPINQK